MPIIKRILLLQRYGSAITPIIEHTRAALNFRRIDGNSIEMRYQRYGSEDRYDKMCTGVIHRFACDAVVSKENGIVVQKYGRVSVFAKKFTATVQRYVNNVMLKIKFTATVQRYKRKDEPRTKLMGAIQMSVSITESTHIFNVPVKRQYQVLIPPHKSKNC